ncbi:hypothetical protein [Bacillus thuringiensis]|uniref:hypothetical protein n=1 Tax=Bacillus thuringiensis TaxID=1428 RepID=UPI0011A2C56E|nr:hypothetical protein [Bacillus thuringiensis]
MVRLKGSGKEGVSGRDGEGKGRESKKGKEGGKWCSCDFSEFGDLGDLKRGKEKERVVEGEEEERRGSRSKTEEEVIESKQEVV